MNKDDIIRMAIDAIGGDMNGQDVQHLVWRLENFDTDVYEFGPDALLKFAALIAAAEREAIKQRVLKSDMTMANRLYVVNDLIRARGQA